MNEKEKKSAYDKLTPQRKQLVDEVLKNLESGAGLWKQGWKVSGVPISAITGKRYNGVNRIFLAYATMLRGYTDNRWVTFNQMEKKGWSFKRDAEGNSLGKNAGVAIEYFEFRDRETKKPFDKYVLDGMTADERDAYIDENVYAIRKYYRVFNGDVIEGIPALEVQEHDPSGRNERAERILQLWSDTEAKIIYGGNEAYYSPLTDKIHVPEREKFVDMPEFYGTSFHEIGHSTGHEKRLNRELGERGTPEYAVEELRAEIACMFLMQDLGIVADEKHIQNNSAYIQHWHNKIKEDPNILFTAIADAEKISKFVMSKEKANQKEVEPYSIVEDTNANGDQVYELHMTEEYGQTRTVMGGFESREALMDELAKMQELPFWANKEFKEVTFEELQEESRRRAEEQEAKVERLREVEEEKSEVFMPPSEVAAIAAGEAAVEEETVAPVEMTGRGIESLTRMDDRDVVDRASKTKHGEKFLQLYNGVSVLGNEEKDERSLMARLAMFTKDDKEQLMRVFKSSGLFRAEKPSEYYEQMAKEEMKFVASLRTNLPTAVKNTGGRFANAKS